MPVAAPAHHTSSNHPASPQPGRFSWENGLALFLWAWAIWSCAEHWENNPNYSYGWAVPVLALGFALRRFFLAPAATTGGHSGPGRAWLLLAAAGAAAWVFGLEYARLQVWRPQVVLTAICFGAIFWTFLVLWSHGGFPLLRRQLFPVLFFLTAVPWPPRFEQPLTSALMVGVAQATVELLHWSGIEAKQAGGAIALSTGLVGVTEACSGIRSLQAGIMFGLAMGEWFLLGVGRRLRSPGGGHRARAGDESRAHPRLVPAGGVAWRGRGGESA